MRTQTRTRGARNQLTDPRDKWQSYLLKAVDIGLVAVVLVAPIFMGGRHPVGELVYIALVCATALAWMARCTIAGDSGWNRSGVEMLLLGGLLLFITQLTPWPPALLHGMSPSLADTLPLWTSGESASTLGTWTQISLFPAATRGLLAMFLAHAMLFLLVVQRVRDQADVERLLRWLAIGVVVMAALGIAQFLLSNGKFLWVYQHASRDTNRVVKGPFINENHFAHFLALGIGPVLWWIQSALRATASKGKQKRESRRGFHATQRGTQVDGRQLLTLGALGIVLLAGLLTFSRGGVVILLLALTVGGGIYAWKSLLSRRAIAALSGVGLLVVVALLIYGYTPLSNQLSSLGAGSIDEVDHHAARRKLWTADLMAYSDFRLFGTGGGTHAEVYPMYYESYADREYIYAESGYVQILLEFGTAGVILLAVALGCFCWWCLRSLWKSNSASAAACAGAVSASLAASVVHSIWDFVWYIPSCMSLTVILAALACRLHQLSKSDEQVENAAPAVGRSASPSTRKLHTAIWIGSTAVTLVISVAMIRNQIGPAVASVHWDRYRALAVVAQGDGYIVSDATTNDAMLRQLQNTVRWDPHHARAQLMLAALRLQRFDIQQQTSLNPMPLSQIRDAVLTGGFTNSAALSDWLSAAVGKNRELLSLARRDVRTALAACPLQGDGYVYLADLAFLDSNLQPSQLVNQALRVRPYSGPVLVKAGADAAVAGDFPSALDFWKRAYHQDPQQRSRLVETLAPNMPAAFFLKEFQPDRDAARQIYQAFRGLGRDDQARDIGTVYVPMLIREAENGGDNSVATWQQAADVCRFLGDVEQTLSCLRAAVRAAPNDYGVHHLLGMELFRQEQFDEAVTEIEWCLFRKPADARLRNVRARALRGRAEKSLGAVIANPESASGLR